MAIDWSIDRRGLFYGTFAALLGGALGFGRGAAEAALPEMTLISAARIAGADGGAVVSREGVAPFALPGRAHAVLKLPESGEIVLVGRRPGTFAAILDEQAPDRAPGLISPIAGHRFAGHAAASPDGAILVTSEIDAQSGEGVVVSRDARTGTPLQVFPVGIEPHDLVFAQGGARLIVAVGGIARAADVKGPPINAGAIESALLELDPNSGAVLKRHALPADMASLSLRHLALAPDNVTVAFGMQDQDRSMLRPVMGLLRVGAGVELLPLPAEDQGALRFYIGSVVIDAAGRYLAAASPKGGVVGLWRLSDGRWLDSFRLADVCGLASGEAQGTFWATSGFGDVVDLIAVDEGFTTRAHWRADAAFDNHLLRL